MCSFVEWKTESENKNCKKNKLFRKTEKNWRKK